MSNPLALIVEDDPKLAFIFAEALHMADFETETVHHGQAALDRLAVITPRVVVLDLHLPQVSGLDILAHIRADQRLAQTHIILTTADAPRAELLRKEVDLVLLKPISVHQLITLAKRLHSSDPPAESAD